MTFREVKLRLPHSAVLHLHACYNRSIYGTVKEKVDYEKSRGSYGQTPVNNTMLAIDDKSNDNASANSSATAGVPQQQMAMYQQGAPGAGIGRPEGIRGGGQVGKSIQMF